MHLICFIFLIVCITSNSETVLASENKESLKNNLNVNTEFIEGLFRHMKGYEARMTKEINIMQDKFKKQEFEILRLRKLISSTRSKDWPNDEYMHYENYGKNQRSIRKKDLVIARRIDADVHVAFSALLSADAQHLGQNQNVAFDNVLVNDGNAYNPHDGLFVAPYTGVYAFSTLVTIKERDSTHFGIAKNGNVLTLIYVDGSEKWYDSSTQTLVIHLQAGDDVSVKHTQSDKTLHGDNYSSFSGFLLYRSINDESVVG